jgi:hypothetical protein
MDKMKINEEYFVWGVVLTVVVFAVVYSLNIREHLDTTGGVRPTCPAGTVLSTLPEDLGKCAIGRSDGKAIRDATCPEGKVYNKMYNLCLTEIKATTTETTGEQTLQTTSPICGMNYEYNRTSMKCVGLNDSVTPRSIDPTCPTGTTFDTKYRTCTFKGALKQTQLNAPGAVSAQLDAADPITALASGLLSSGVDQSDSADTALDYKSTHIRGRSLLRLYDDPDYINGGFDSDVLPSWSGSSSSAAGPGDAYIRKSSLVPCTCTTHSMGCERHGGGKDSSTVPGDKDGALGDGKSDQFSAQDQNGLKRPFSKAFEEQGEPTGFLTSFAAFG